MSMYSGLSTSKYLTPSMRRTSLRTMSLGTSLRSDSSEQVVFAVVCHFGGAMRDYRIGVQRRGFWREVVNTNSGFYGGSGVGNDGGRGTEDIERDGFSQSIVVTLPPLSAFVFKWGGGQ